MLDKLGGINVPQDRVERGNKPSGSIKGEEYLLVTISF